MAVPSIHTLGSLVQSLLPPSIFLHQYTAWRYTLIPCLKILVFFWRVKPVTFCARQTQHDKTATTCKFSSIMPRLQPPLPEVLPVSAFPASVLHPALPSMICSSKQCFATYSEEYIRGVPCLLAPATHTVQVVLKLAAFLQTLWFSICGVLHVIDGEFNFSISFSSLFPIASFRKAEITVSKLINGKASCFGLCLKLWRIKPTWHANCPHCNCHTISYEFLTCY